jgi:hypothetical protein
MDEGVAEKSSSFPPSLAAFFQVSHPLGMGVEGLESEGRLYETILKDRQRSISTYAPAKTSRNSGVPIRENERYSNNHQAHQLFEEGHYA